MKLQNNLLLSLSFFSLLTLTACSSTSLEFKNNAEDTEKVKSLEKDVFMEKMLIPQFVSSNKEHLLPYLKTHVDELSNEEKETILLRFMSEQQKEITTQNFLQKHLAFDAKIDQIIDDGVLDINSIDDILKVEDNLTKEYLLNSYNNYYEIVNISRNGSKTYAILNTPRLLKEFKPYLKEETVEYLLFNYKEYKIMIGGNDVDYNYNEIVSRIETLEYLMEKYQDSMLFETWKNSSNKYYEALFGLNHGYHYDTINNADNSYEFNIERLTMFETYLTQVENPTLKKKIERYLAYLQEKEYKLTVEDLNYLNSTLKNNATISKPSLQNKETINLKERMLKQLESTQ